MRRGMKILLAIGLDFCHNLSIWQKSEDWFEVMINLTKAPLNKQLRIIEFRGGHGLRRRLISLGFHKNDVISLDSRSLFGGPILIRNLTSDTIVALGRGIARKLWVEVIEAEE
jgi:Fe2+ transport system protein FeoA